MWWVTLLLVYSCASVIEWSLHRFLMHNPRMRLGKFHIAHHSETLEDMTLRGEDHPFLPAHEWRGTGFSWKMTMRLLVPLGIMCGLVGSLTREMQTSVLSTILIFTYSLLTWNAIHPELHGMAQPPFSYGPSLPFHVPWKGYLVRHHIQHHHSKGRSNFNITLPGADLVLGTFEAAAS